MASTRKTLPPAGKLARHVLLPPLLAVVAICCLLLAIAVAFGQGGAKATNPLAKQGPSHDDLARQLATDLEGTPSPADIRRAQKPLSERRRLLAAHPYFSLYTIAKQRFGVSLYLVAAVHYQETGFGKAPAQYATYRRWTRHRNAIRHIVRPTRYPHKTARHPSTNDDFDVVMAIGAGLKAARLHGLGPGATRTIAKRYGASPEGRLSAAMVLERARAWQLLGTLPMPGSGELATPVKGVVGGCGYFGCPRPGHLHNGVDFLAPSGVPIHAADGGVVASVESPGESGGYGNFVCIQHRPNLATCYAHMSAFAASIRPGARVWRGQVIGLVGSTGSSTAPHLHFEVRRGPAAVLGVRGRPAAAALRRGPGDRASEDGVLGARDRARRATLGGPCRAQLRPPWQALRAASATGTGEPEDPDEPVPDPPIDATPRAQPRGPLAHTGGTRPTETTPARPAPPAHAPQPATPAAPEPAPAPAPEEDTGTGGAAVDFSAPPPPPPPPADPVEAQPAPAQGGG